jgi:hypothetical protein
VAWIESHQEVAHHPKTRKLAKRLDCSLAAAIGHLHALWWWAVSFADDGDLSRHTDEDIALGSVWEDDPKTFVDALVECRWLDRDGETLTLHDWEEYAGRLLDRRRTNAERKRQSRARHADGGAASGGVTGLPNQTITRPDQTQPDRTKPENAGKPARTRRDIEAAKWKPTVEMIDWAADNFPAVDISDETQKFIDHFLANGKPMKDWNAAWRNWIRRSVEFKAVAR